ncbi:hypothetical protein BDQ17DRAFT_1376753 [Cyathus striatus]|nr:hypothetical protein BDQ17DRAFT_1376753 [Cyathus striatus]
MSSEKPMGSSTCSTKAFEIIYTTLAMGEDCPFFGIDMGADWPNLKLIVRPMGYSMSQ